MIGSAAFLCKNPRRMQTEKRSLLVVLFCAAVLFTANARSLSLLSLDDCFYARKGIELGRSGRFFTVTWNYHPTFQNPPLPFWILGRCFQWFGENDFSARLPSILMALGILALTYRLGRLVLGERSALAAVCFLLLTPQFDSNARRCMLEVPTTFWIMLCFCILVEGIRKPRIHLLIAIPLAGALLTKSVLGLLPLFVFAVFCVLHSPARDSLRKPWIWIGCAVGIALGASWPIHEWMTFGTEALRAHYFAEIAARSTQSLPLWKHFFGYPLILLGSFQPLIIPAFAGAVILWKQRRETAGLMLAWAAIPIFLYSFSSAQSSRYVFPILPALALFAGAAIERFSRRVSALLTRIAPAVLIIVAAIFWTWPQWIVEDENKIFKEEGGLFQRIPETEALAYWGHRYWKYANPLLYYDDRLLDSPARDFTDAVSRSHQRESKLLLCDRDPATIQQIDPSWKIVRETPDWLLLSVKN